MASEQIRRHYRRFRAAGWRASQSYHAAITQVKWDALESLGCVRLRAEPDDDPDLSFLDDWTETRGDIASAKMVREDAERNGVWGTISGYRTDFRVDDSGEWVDDSDDAYEEADSCWGHLGYSDPTDPVQNAYVIDHQNSAIDAFRVAWKAHVHRSDILHSSHA